LNYFPHPILKAPRRLGLRTFSIVGSSATQPRIRRS